MHENTMVRWFLSLCGKSVIFPCYNISVVYLCCNKEMEFHSDFYKRPTVCKSASNIDIDII